MSDEQIQRRLRVNSFVIAGTALLFIVLFAVTLLLTRDFLRALVVEVFVAIGVLAIVMIAVVFVGGIDSVREIRKTMRAARGRPEAKE